MPYRSVHPKDSPGGFNFETLQSFILQETRAESYVITGDAVNGAAGAAVALAADENGDKVVRAGTVLFRSSSGKATMATAPTAITVSPIASGIQIQIMIP